MTDCLHSTTYMNAHWDSSQFETVVKTAVCSENINQKTGKRKKIYIYRYTVCIYVVLCCILITDVFRNIGKDLSHRQS